MLASIKTFCRKHWEALFVTAIYGAAYFFYRQVMQVPFDFGPLTYYWQYLDVELLKHDLLRSLWYMHSQPPLMNFIAGVALQLSGDQVPLLEYFYFGLGIIAVLFLDRALTILRIRPFLRVAICAWLCLHPTFILYANWAYTPHLEITLCCAVLYYLAKLFRDEQCSFGNGVALFVPFMLLELIRPQWHLVFLAGLVLVILLLCRRLPGKIRFVQGGVLALCPVLLICLKNLLLFGFFGASSWLGMNLAQIASTIISPTELHVLQERGEVSQNFPVSFNTDKADQVREKWIGEGRPVVNIEHPSLDRKKTNGEVNQNYLPYIEGSPQDLSDSLAIIAHAPMAYVNEVARRITAVAQIPSSFGRMGPAGSYDYQRWVGAFKEWLSQGAFAFYVVCPALALLLALWPKGYIAQHRPLVLTGIMMVAFVAVSSSAFTYGGESERMRWPMEPFYLMFFAMLIEAALRWVNDFKRRRPEE